MADTFTDAIDAAAEGRPMFSQEGLDILRTFEGFRPNAYYDLDNKKKKGKLTVGYGFTDNDIPDLRPGYTIDKARAEQMLPDLINRKYGPSVLDSVKVPLNDQQYSALTSLVYNIGPTNFSKSTLLKKLNSGDFEGAAEQFKVWNKAGGKTLEGLTKRRGAEEALFKGDIQSLGSILEEQRFGTPKLGKDLSEASTPMPDFPEMTPEERGVAAAEGIAKSIEEVTSPEKAAGTKGQKQEEETIPFASSVSFSGNLPSLPSGLPRNSGLGRRTS
jgi:GH24 family phage-related lysozyme (muramidase)